MAETVDQIIMVHARSGVVERRSLLAAGVSASSIDRRVRHRQLEPLGGGVYLIPALSDDTSLAVAAVVALSDAAISRSTAGRMLGFAIPGRATHVTVAYGRRLSVKGVIVHETRRWLAGDIMQIDNLPVTSPARTVIDLASELSTRRLRHLVETQLIKESPDPTELLAAFTAHRRRGLTGSVKLAAVLTELLDDQPLPASVLEAKVFEALSTRGIDGFRRQFRPPWYDGRFGVVDFAHPGARLILEADGRRWHAVTQSQTDDHRRDRAAVAAGWAVLRVGWTEITNRRDAVLDEIAGVVAHRLEAFDPPATHRSVSRERRS